MIETKSTERADRHEKAILVKLLLPNADYNADDPLDEIRGLAETAGLVVAGGMLQKRRDIDIATYVGSGKVGELKELVEAHEADEQPRRDRRGWRGRRGWDTRVDRGGWRDRRVDVEVRTHLRERGGRRGERFRYRGR